MIYRMQQKMRPYLSRSRDWGPIDESNMYQIQSLISTKIEQDHCLVAKARLELARRFRHRLLKPGCLPIPPLSRIKVVLNVQ